jgi:hypothetical protein
LTVTAEDIRKARKEIKDGLNCSIAFFCPISQSVRRRFPTARQVITGPSRFWVDSVCYTLPPRAVEFIVRFGDNKPVKPFSFYAKS